MDWLDLLTAQETLKNPLQYHSSKASILWCSSFFSVQLSHLCMTTGNHRIKEVKSRLQRRANTCSHVHRPEQHLCVGGQRAAKTSNLTASNKDIPSRGFGTSQGRAPRKQAAPAWSCEVFSKSWSLRPGPGREGGRVCVRVRASVYAARCVTVVGTALHLCSPAQQTPATQAHPN